MTIQTSSVRFLLQILTGDPVLAIESAKKLVSGRERIEDSLLFEIAKNRLYKKWSRIAVIYVLGFTGNRTSVPILIRILKDQTENSVLRAHAAEALGNLKDKRAVSALGQVVLGKEQKSLQKWSVYGLSEIGGRRARSVLNTLETTKPTGIVARELKLALGKL
jgi:hypothetical protein